MQSCICFFSVFLTWTIYCVSSHCTLLREGESMKVPVFGTDRRFFFLGHRSLLLTSIWLPSGHILCLCFTQFLPSRKNGLIMHFIKKVIAPANFHLKKRRHSKSNLKDTCQDSDTTMSLSLEMLCWLDAPSGSYLSIPSITDWTVKVVYIL